jgi:hypothetical protein
VRVGAGSQVGAFTVICGSAATGLRSQHCAGQGLQPG